MRNEFPDIVERGRITRDVNRATDYGEKQGAFRIRHNGNMYLFIISEGMEWDHVSMSLNRKRCPTWEEMCWAKDLFFSDDETVIQYHPPKKDHVNCHPHCLHLWRFQGEMPAPDSWMVGPKDG